MANIRIIQGCIEIKNNLKIKIIQVKTLNYQLALYFYRK
jgi:ADP-dependent phosphofructokinase/glucokinase